MTPKPPVAPKPSPPPQTPTANSKPSRNRSITDHTSYWFVDMKGFIEKEETFIANAFSPNHPLWMPDPRAGNDVKILLNGEETYREMTKALDPYPKKWPLGSFIYLANWIVFDDFNLERDPQDHLNSKPNTTLRDYLKGASEKNVLIRALFWDRVVGSGNTHQNRGPRDFINSLPGGHAILDGRIIHHLPDIGSHHQKLLLVNGPDGLVAFAGGVDFHPNRVFGYNDELDNSPKADPPTIAQIAKVVVSSSTTLLPKINRLDDKSAPLLDVHVRIRGPAAYDLLDIFLQRYVDHPSAAGQVVYAPFRDYKPLPDAGITVRVCTTFGDAPVPDPSLVFPTEKTLKSLQGPQAGRKNRESNVFTAAQDIGAVTVAQEFANINITPTTFPPATWPYSFAPRGRQSGRAQLLYAISGARKFIYFEDQYMVSQEIAETIRDVVNKYGVQVIGVIPHQSISGDFDLPEVGEVIAGALGASIGSNVIAKTRLSRVIRVIYGKDADPQKLTFLFSPLQTQPSPGGSIYRYVHSKVFIIDDAFCTIGSMNFNRRSTTHDSELSLGFYEPNPKTVSFAKQLRLRLWQQHLGVPEDAESLIEDPFDSIANVWRKISSSPRDIWAPGGIRLKPKVVRYDWSKDVPLGISGGSGLLGIIGSETNWVNEITDPVVTSDETARLPKR